MGTATRTMILTKLGNAFLLLTIAMVESESPPMECCTQKIVGDDHYTLWHDLFHRSLPYECLNDCVYTKTGTSSPKFCFVRGDLRTECLSDEVEIEIESQVDISGGDHGSGSGSGSGDHETNYGSGSGGHESGSGSAPTIELVGGAGPHEGNIMIKGRSVCDHGRNPENAKVVCRQLGYLGGNLTIGSHFGQVSEDFGRDNVQCNGTEDYIWRCPHETEVNCTRDEGMGVICSGVKMGVMLVVKDGKSGETVAGAKVQIMFADEGMTATTDSDGRAIFALRPYMIGQVKNAGSMADIAVSAANYYSFDDPQWIDPNLNTQAITITIFPLQ